MTNDESGGAEVINRPSGASCARVVGQPCSPTEILKESLCSPTTGARTRAREDRQTQTTGHVCEKCGRKITEGIASYSLDQYGMKLCKTCQEKTPKKSSPAWTGDQTKPDADRVRKQYQKLLEEESDQESEDLAEYAPDEEYIEEVPF